MTKGATICPVCQKERGERVEMAFTLLPHSDPELRDRFPGEISMTLEYQYAVKWTCPKCKREDFE